eukprot:TRINITY_DN6964_c0_g1_i1.p1 TRINITY_DN6964_c0_g1~~TRINITY_DN6964_c0_g1_i1.p1  ORF type:complete len:308 (+),score=21.85 TRINITY_DN6964_c0_g1_i1:45-926(+)
MSKKSFEAEEQRAAVKEMEQAAKALTDILESTEEMGLEERTLDHFERDIREMNQIHALNRVESIVGGAGKGWNKALEDKVETRQIEEEETEGLLSLVGAAREDDNDEPASDPFEVQEMQPLPPRRPSEPRRSRCSSIASSRMSVRRNSESYRVVGSLTPDMVSNIRRTSGRSASIVRPSSARSPSAPCVSADGSIARRSLVQRRSTVSSLHSGAARPSFRQRDTSCTRVTGRVDYSELLQEQQTDLTQRRASMKEYYCMLDQVEDYQSRMLESLDRQLVFMGINSNAPMPPVC